jgi:hypothetical protein
VKPRFDSRFVLNIDVIFLYTDEGQVSSNFICPRMV